ncbi:MAG: hypothetical protein U9P14_10860, partial [Gemmatimonadota bacterium]|nr:hypothetical protein [Gemmatimonadota bacterium]
EMIVVRPDVLRWPLYVQHPLEHTVLRSPHEWRFVLRGHRGDWKTANAPALGWEVNQPLLSREVISIAGSRLPEGASIISAENSSVVVSAIKKSYYDNSFVLHCAELLDTDTRLEVRPGLIELRAAKRVNLAEDEMLPGPVTLPRGGFSLALDGFSVEAVSFSGSRK